MSAPPLPSRGWTGGFNLLPWRRREAARLRRRLVLEWLAAALLGCACAAPFAGWRAWQRAQIEREHRALDRSLAQLLAPLAEQRRLQREADERRVRMAAAQARAKPLARLFGLLDELAAPGVAGVSLDEVVHRAHETGLQATVSGEAATAEWLARLRTLPEVGNVSLREVKRAAAGGAPVDQRQQGPLQVTAHLAWDGGDAPRDGKQRARGGK